MAFVWVGRVAAALALASLLACARLGVAAAAGVEGMVLAGPTCPVVTVSPDPGCEDRPVEGAVLVIRKMGGEEVARVTSDDDGEFAVDLPAGQYRIVPQPVEGLMGTAPPVDVQVPAGTQPVEVTISYDTGIR